MCATYLTAPHSLICCSMHGQSYLFRISEFFLSVRSVPRKYKSILAIDTVSNHSQAKKPVIFGQLPKQFFQDSMNYPGKVNLFLKTVLIYK